MHQGKYTKDVLKKFDMGEAKPLSTPMSTTTALDADGRRSRGPKRVPQHDRVAAVPDGDETRHSVRRLPLRVLSGFAAHVSPSGRQADQEVPSFHV